MAIYHYQFQAYHPYLTFSDPKNSLFVRIIDEMPAEPENTDNDALFSIGKDVYKRLPSLKSREDFDKDFLIYHEAMDDLRVILKKLVDSGVCGTGLSDGTIIDVDLENAADQFILAMTWWSVQLKHFDPSTTLGIKCELKVLFSYLALIHIDKVFVFNANQTEGAIESTIQAAFALSNVLAIESEDENAQRLKSESAYHAAAARHQATTYVRRQEVIDYYIKHIYPLDPKKSNDKVAEILDEKFNDISFRTLSKYVGQAKKEMKNIPPASKV